MKTTSVLSAAALCLLASACADTIPAGPSTSGLTGATVLASARGSTVVSDEATAINADLASVAAQLGVGGADQQIMKAELLYAANAYSASSPTLILANDRLRGIGAEWVKGDPRRGGRTGVSWSIVPFGGLPWKYDPTVPGAVRPATVTEIVARLQEGMATWTDRTCSDAPVTAVNGEDADIIHALWLPMEFFIQNWGPNGAGILGVTLSSVFGTPGNFTDIDNNGKADLAQSIIVYNAGHLWSDNGPLGTTDLYSVIAHESGHAFGLGHFGKVFVTKNDQHVNPDGTISINVEDIKYAPKALMNAVYVMGRDEVTGTDNSSFCQIWASTKK